MHPKQRKTVFQISYFFGIAWVTVQVYFICSMFFLFQLFTNLLDLASVLFSGLEPVLFDKNVTAKSATKF